MAKRNKREKDTLDNIIDQLDLNGVTHDELFGENGLVKALPPTSSIKLGAV